MQHRNVNKYLKLLQISFSKCLQTLHSFPILTYNLQNEECEQITDMCFANQ
jgi:hypothetical protein